MATDEDIQKELDIHIHRLEQELCELKRKRNTLSPISRLPPEIFCQIFLLSISELGGYKDASGRRLPPATALSHISHTWRDVAIGCPELWGIIRVGVRTRGDMLSVAAARAQQAPIILNMCGFEREGTPSIPSEEAISTLSGIVREGAARCSKFELYAREDSLQSLVSGFSASFDSLTTLKIDIVGTNDRNAPLTELLQCTFPRLRHLKVERPSIPLDCNLLRSPHLTHVDVEELMYTTTLLSDLLALLKRSLCLQSFAAGPLIHGLASEVPSVKGGSPIHVPKLELLKFNSTFDTAARLLSFISFPPHCRLNVYAVNRAESVQLMSSVAQAYGHLAPVALHLEADSLKAWEVSPVNVATGQVDTNTCDTPWIHIRGSRMARIWDFSGWSFVNLRALLLSYFALADNQCVIDTNSAVATNFWALLAGSAGALEVIHITDNGMDNAVSDTLMDCLRGAKTGKGNSTVPWPALQSLRSPLPFQSQWGQEYKRRREDASTPSLHHQLEYAFDLVDALKAREFNGSTSSIRPLTSLEFSTPFAEPVKHDASLILRSGAATVKWRTYARKNQP